MKIILRSSAEEEASEILKALRHTGSAVVDSIEVLDALMPLLEHQDAQRVKYVRADGSELAHHNVVNIRERGLDPR